MFDRLQRPFLTVETGEAYQPLRLTYQFTDKAALVSCLDQLGCVARTPNPDSWNWYWQAECEELHFESIDSFKRNAENPNRLGTLVIKNDRLYISLPSFKRACMAVGLFHRLIDSKIALVWRADFINKIFGLDERLPHGFTELFKDEELDRILDQREKDYHEMQARCEEAPTAEEAFAILHEYTTMEAKKRLPYAERYVFDFEKSSDTEIIFLSFYVFLRGRELVATKRWFGEIGYSLADAAEETVEQIFGDMNIDILE